MAARQGSAKSARTRERILDAAARILSRNGYAGTRLSDIADEAGLQAPAIYYYFPSREDLVEEVMWAGIARMAEHVGAALSGPGDTAAPLQRILTAVESHIRYELEISDYTTAAIRNAGQLPEKIRARQLIEEHKYGELWRRLFDDAHKAGLLRPGLDPFAARMLVLGALNWTAEWWNPRRGSIDAMIRTAKTIVLHGISGAGSAQGVAVDAVDLGRH